MSHVVQVNFKEGIVTGHDKESDAKNGERLANKLVNIMRIQQDIRKGVRKACDKHKQRLEAQFALVMFQALQLKRENPEEFQRFRGKIDYYHDLYKNNG